jgi:phosphopantothenoylcysteine decarboxylase/phosphopantothenate--cysteine ligase
VSVTGKAQRGPLAGKHVVVGVGGGIAAFKAVVLVRELQRRGAEVRVAMTKSATRFVGAVSFSGLTGRPPVVDLFDTSHAGEVHVELAAWADAIVVAPATANVLARAASGMADDAVLATLSCASCPILLAPAMHENMWLAAATQRNARRLEEDGAVLVGPVSGLLASGASGMGRMAEPEAIADALQGALDRRGAKARDLLGKTVLVSAGPTLEDIDPVRYITNRSSGRMGMALVQAALERGAHVVLVAGPTEVKPPPAAELFAVRSAEQMQRAIEAALPRVDAVVMTAAVADYRPKQPGKRKLKKEPGKTEMTIELVRNPDILATLGAQRTGKRPVLVGFAMETHDLVAYGKKKLVDKRCDLIVANQADIAFGGDENQATLITADGEEALETMAKLQLAHRIWDRVVELLS